MYGTLSDLIENCMSIRRERSGFIVNSSFACTNKKLFYWQSVQQGRASSGRSAGGKEINKHYDNLNASQKAFRLRRLSVPFLRHPRGKIKADSFEVAQCRLVMAVLLFIPPQMLPWGKWSAHLTDIYSFVPRNIRQKKKLGKWTFLC